MGFVTKFVRFNWRERFALAEAMVMVMVAAPLVRWLPFRILAKAISRPIATPLPQDEARRERGDLVGWAVDRAAKRSPLRAMCIECGVAAQWMLRRRGVDSTLFYGIGLSGGSGAALSAREIDAHVWVMDGAIDICGLPEPGRYAVVARFPVEQP
jgi:hypothetical protein